ncbi:MAG TPA: ribosome small subunit-dependent GTPase A [Wenzhouxiangella sp.]|nr:ribosome small subunit-dependent GTPase A [Wenzhouxiangella sp.]
MVETAGRAPVRVVQAHANHGVVLVDGQARKIHFPRRLSRPLAGDWVHVDSQGTLEKIVPRTNSFGRGDGRGRFRAIAANIDRALIVIAPEPAPSADLLHRYLAACLIRGVKPVVVVNKSDLERPSQPPFSELGALRQLGYKIIDARCLPRPEIGDLKPLAQSGTTLFSGQSGVGKTSLLNALMPDLNLRTSELSRVTGKGRHTTTTASAYPYRDNAWLIDTPGVWEYSLWAMPLHELQRGFPEFREAPKCRFRDCSHSSEPGCGVVAALTRGLVAKFRHQAWLRLLDEQERLARNS